MMKFRYKVIYGLGMSKRYQLKDEKYTGLQKLQVGVLRFLGKFTTTPKVCKMWEKASSKYQGQKTGWSYACNNAIDETCFYRSDLYEYTDYGIIKGRKFPVPAGYDEELTVHYGDWRKPPEDKDAFVHHADLEE